MSFMDRYGGIIYAPQESRRKEKQLIGMYDRMKGEINFVRVNKEKIIVMQGFNCKTGGKVAGNKEEIKKQGKIFFKVMEKKQMTVQS